MTYRNFRLFIGPGAACLSFMFGVFVFDSVDRISAYVYFQPSTFSQVGLEDQLRVPPIAIPENLADIPVSSSSFGRADEEVLNGWYKLDDYPGFDEVGLILLTPAEGKEYQYEAVVLTNSDFENSSEGPFHETNSAKLSGETISFETKSLGRISYSFKGKFFKARFTGSEGEEVLQGKLVKRVNGRQVASVEGEFKYYTPTCWH